MKFIMALLSGLLLFVACNRNDNIFNARAVNFNGIEMTMKIQNINGQPGSTFNTGDTAVIYFALTNRSGEDRNWWKSDTRPFVTFEIGKDDSLILSSNFGLGFAQVITTGTVENRETLERTWQITFTDSIFTAGNYQVASVPELIFEGMTPLPALREEIKLLP